MQGRAVRINLEEEKKKNTRIAIGIAAFGVASGIVLYIAMFAAFFAFPFVFFKLIPMPSIHSDMVSLEGRLVVLSREVDFSGATFAQAPKEKTMMRTFGGEGLSEPVEVEPYSSLDAYEGKAYFFSEGRYRVYDGSKWEEFGNAAIGGNPVGAVGPGGIWVLSRSDEGISIRRITDSAFEELPLPAAAEEMDICLSNHRLLWAEGGLNLFWRKDGTLRHERYDGTGWKTAGYLGNPDTYRPLRRGEEMLLFTKEMGAELQVRSFDGEGWSGPRGIEIGKEGFLLDFHVAELGDRLAVLAQGLFAEKLYLVEEGGAVEERTLRSPYKFGFTSKVILINLAGYALIALFVFIVSAVIDRYKLRYWPLRRGRALFASVFRRFLAHTIDTLIISLPFAAIGYLILEKGLLPEDLFMFAGLIIVGAGGFLLWAYLYYSLLEGFWGRTAGKWICGIMVLRDNFTRCGLGRAFLRNLLRVVDGMFYYLVALVTIGATLKWQRLGDIAAGTVVVRARRR